VSAAAETASAETNSRTPVQLYGLAFLVQVFWALNNSISKFALAEIPPILLAGLRMAVAAVFMVPIYLWQRPQWKREHFWKLVGLGGIGLGLNQFLFVVGINYTSVTHAALIIPLTPIVALILAALFRMEKLTPHKILGMAIAFGGVMVLQLTKTPSRGASLFGDFLLFLGISFFALYIVLGKRATANYDGIVVNTFGFITSAVALAPLTVWLGRSFDFGRVSLLAWSSMLYMVIFSSIVGYTLYYYVLTHMEASRLSAFSYIQPIMTASFAALLLGEPLTPSLAISGALVLLGVWITSRAQ
jgi:drug/metabolite transporter (DMT)-like permease